jgi:hypothetical protein
MSCVGILVTGTRLGIKREPPSHTKQVRLNQQVRPTLLVQPTLLVRPALHPATIRVPVITTPTSTLWMERIHRGYVGLIQRV